MMIRARSRWKRAATALALASCAWILASAPNTPALSAQMTTPALASPPTHATEGGYVVTGGCSDDPDCDDFNDCTTDQCIDTACVYTNDPDDTPCPDGLFCNGDETCQAGVCTDQIDPCIDEAHCDEQASVCLDCVRLGDGDSDGRVGALDHRLMFDCLTDPVGPVDPPAYAEDCVCFDFDEDGDVDLRDFAAFQTVFERIALVTVELVARTAPGVDDELTQLPAGDSEFPDGESLWVEVWAQTQNPDGLASVYVDLWFDQDLLSGSGITHTDLFDLFPLGLIDNEAGLVREVGGSHLAAQGCSDQVGRAPNWVRVAVIEMGADAPGATTVSSADTDSPFTISVCGTFEVPAAEYGDRELTIVEP